MRSILKAFHLLLRILTPDDKIQFLLYTLVGSLDQIRDPNLVIWIPKIMELLIPFIKDDTRYMFYIETWHLF